MANQELLRILRQGAGIWNVWREEQKEVRIDLRNAKLVGANLSKANLSYANLSYADFNGADLSKVNLSRSDLSSANLSGADLSGANLSKANLRRADFFQAALFQTDLSGTDLFGANLSRANHSEIDMSNARIGWTNFSNIDLRFVKGLNTVEHLGPSTIGIDTLLRSHGDIPETFLRGVGLNDTFISYVRSLAQKPIEYYTCFISYSSKDQEFAERLYADLQSKGVRCWFAPEDLKIGEKFWHRIDESIKLYDKLLVVLSQHSVESEWVEREVVAALEKEQQQHKLVLFPITLDEAFKDTFAPWAADLRRQRHLGDFSRWKDHDSYQKSLNRLLRDLKAGTE
jgi:hypothetical protein